MMTPPYSAMQPVHLLITRHVTAPVIARMTAFLQSSDGSQKTSQMSLLRSLIQLVRNVTKCYSTSIYMLLTGRLLQYVTVCFSLLQTAIVCNNMLQPVPVCYQMASCNDNLQHVTVCYGLLKCVTDLQNIACYKMLQSV